MDWHHGKVAFVCASAHRLPLPDRSAHMIVTSPPYWGPRWYEEAPPVLYAGDLGCQHDFADLEYSMFDRGDDLIARNHVKGSTIGDHRGQAHMRKLQHVRARLCRACGAWEGHLGLEGMHDCLGWASADPDAACGQCYVCHMRQIAAELWRVLRDDGTLWLNIGDTYSGTPRRRGLGAERGQRGAFERPKAPGLRRKNLVGMPFRLALAFQADGWVLRNDIIWHKPNAVPGPEEDRLVKAHEYVLLFSKKPRYFFNERAVREPAVGGGLRRRRDVLSINTRPFNGPHFAVYPVELPDVAIRAGSSLWTCSQCGAPAHVYDDEDAAKGRPHINGFRPTCKCGWQGAPMEQGKAVVLDPFGGSGTTAIAALDQNRRCILVDVSQHYLDLARQRIFGDDAGDAQDDDVDWSGTLFDQSSSQG